MRREDCAGMILGALMDRLDVGRPGRVLDIGRFCFSRPPMTVWRRVRRMRGHDLRQKFSKDIAQGV